MKNLIIFLDKNVKYYVYTEINIHGIYRYLEIIGFPTTLNTSVQLSHYFGPSYSINNYTSTLHPVIAALSMIQKIIFILCGSIGHKADDFIICGPKFLPTSLRKI